METKPLLPVRTYTDKQKARVRLLVDALRSGEYRQTCGALRFDGMHCAEGVACDVYRRFAKKGAWVGANTFRDGYGNKAGEEMPYGVGVWFGFRSPRTEHSIDTEDNVVTLIPLNEEDAEDEIPKMTFAEIADVLEREILGGPQ